MVSQVLGIAITLGVMLGPFILGWASPVFAAQGRLRIRWLGHACFLITTPQGTRIVTDPFDETVGYRVPDVETDIVTISHDHFDHNNSGCLRGHPKVVKGAGEQEIKGVKITGVATFHDQEKGARRGANTVFVLDIDGVRICHLGDLGHMLTPENVAKIGRVDILLIPVGGNYTIDATGATRVVELLKPKVVIPMHYKTKAIGFPIDPVDRFLAGKKDVIHQNSTTLEVSGTELPKETTIYVLNYE